MRTVNPYPSLAIAAIAAATTALCGCHDPEFKIRQSQRDQRINRLISDARYYEDYRRARIDWLFETNAQMNEWRAGHLRSTIKTAEHIEDRRRRNWEEYPPSESIVIQRMIHGSPDQIPSVWARMIY